MKAKRILAMLLAAIMLLNTAACGKKGEDKNKEDAETTAAAKVEEETKADAPADEPASESATNAPEASNPGSNAPAANAVFTDSLATEKIGTLNRDSFTTNKGGLVYKENNLYGIISFEGVYDTGASYAQIEEKKQFFMARKTKPTSIDDINALNGAQLLNGKGQAVIPGTFAAFDILSDRFVLAVKATNRTYAKDKTLITYSTTGLTYTSALSGTGYGWYEGTWTVYDLMTGKPVAGVTGTHADFFATAKGDFVKFKKADGSYTTIHANGTVLPDGVSLFDDGSYKVESRIGDVYAADGTRLFSYDLTGYVPKYVYGEYYSASKYVDGKTTYAVMNKKGEILSEGYPKSITVYGEIVMCDGAVFGLNGQRLVEGTYTSVYEDDIFGKNYILLDANNYTMIDAKGNVYLVSPKASTNVYTNEFVASKKIGDKYYYYSHKDKDFTIEGYSFAPWVVKTPNANSMYDLVDTMTGKTILEGYNNYSKIPYGTNAYYVYAKYNGGTDVYLIISGSQIKKVTDTKTSLFNDLATSFNTSGIKVTVDSINGEIALDTAILFGGDSATLSAEGKAVLNKFIKAYSTVVFSDKYKGFITKTLIEGHTAPLPGSTYASGYNLSLERATNVMNYCLSPEAGLDPNAPIASTLEAVGYSNSQPIYNADGTVNLDASRRVSFRFMINIEF